MIRFQKTLHSASLSLALTLVLSTSLTHAKTSKTTKNQSPELNLKCDAQLMRGDQNDYIELTKSAAPHSLVGQDSSVTFQGVTFSIKHEQDGLNLKINQDSSVLLEKKVANLKTKEEKIRERVGINGGFAQILCDLKE